LPEPHILSLHNFVPDERCIITPSPKLNPVHSMVAYSYVGDDPQHLLLEIAPNPAVGTEILIGNPNDPNTPWRLTPTRPYTVEFVLAPTPGNSDRVKVIVQTVPASQVPVGEAYLTRRRLNGLPGQRLARVFMEKPSGLHYQVLHGRLFPGSTERRSTDKYVSIYLVRDPILK
jgi:hypothetical protein